MTLSRARRIGRVFAVALLLWTAVDLLDFGVCENNHVRLGTHTQATLQSPAEQDGCGPHHCHDCFCCSPYVDVQVPFLIHVAAEATPAVSTDPVLVPLIAAAPLYHPPLA